MTTLRYDPRPHSKTIERLASTPRTTRLFFSLWCIDALWPWGGEMLRKRLTPTAYQAIVDCYEGLWREALGELPTTTPAAISTALSGFAVDPDDFGGALRSAAVIADLLEAAAARTNETKLASTAGTEVLEQLTFFARNSPELPPNVASAQLQRELENQQVMIDRLLQAAPSKDLRTFGRETTLFAHSDDRV